MSRLLVIDGLNILRRVYEANNETDPALKAETAQRHALSSFRKLLSTHHPTHALAVFDGPGPTWRHALHPDYRAGHAPPPVELEQRLPEFQEQLRALPLAVVSVPGFEADDAIATVVMRWLGEGRGEAVVASSDHDLHGLIAHGALLWDHFKGEWHDAAWVEAKFGVRPEQLPELLALVGDKADGVPGVSKVGMKTAAKLLQTYGNLDGVMAGAGILMNPLGERLRRERANLDLSRHLTSLRTDVRLGVTWNMLALQHTPQ